MEVGTRVMSPAIRAPVPGSHSRGWQVDQRGRCPRRRVARRWGPGWCRWRRNPVRRTRSDAVSSAGTAACRCTVTFVWSRTKAVRASLRDWGTLRSLILRSQHAGVFLDGGAHKARVLDRDPPGPLIQGFAESSDIDPRSRRSALAPATGRSGAHLATMVLVRRRSGPTGSTQPPTFLACPTRRATTASSTAAGASARSAWTIEARYPSNRPAAISATRAGARWTSPTAVCRRPVATRGRRQDGRDQLGRIRPVLQPAVVSNSVSSSSGQSAGIRRSRSTAIAANTSTFSASDPVRGLLQRHQPIQLRLQRHQRPVPPHWGTPHPHQQQERGRSHTSRYSNTRSITTEEGRQFCCPAAVSLRA